MLRLRGDHPGPGARRAPGLPAAGLLAARRSGGLVGADVRADALVRPRAPRRPQGHARLGPDGRHAAEPHPQPVHLRRARRRRRGAHRAARHRPRRRRRVRDLPRGRQLHPRAPQARHREAPRAWLPPDGRPGRGDAQRPGAAARRVPGGAGGVARDRRAAGGAHRPRPRADRGRRVARAADGQGDHHAVVAGAARGDPRGPRGADRLALPLVGGHRPLGRGAQAAGPRPDRPLRSPRTPPPPGPRRRARAAD